ncbi:hypothetical protein C8Q74DRAFT_1368007 [Fomes fomentarius]|nr:hypothetical protein C8Q74DRAFT_1368007 [Fomes fomentarius]
MSRSTCKSFRDEWAAATFKTPDEVPFLSWTEDGQCVKAWERGQGALGAEKAAAEEAKRREEEAEEELCVEKMIEADEEEEDIVQEVKKATITPPAQVTNVISITLTDTDFNNVVLQVLPLPSCDVDRKVNARAIARSFKVFVDVEVAAPVPASVSVDLLGNQRTRAVWTGDEDERKENVNGGCVVKAWRAASEGVQREALKVLKTKTKKSSGKRIRIGAESEGKKRSTRVRTRKDSSPKTGIESTAQRQRHTLT